TSLVVPSPSATSMRASLTISASMPAVNWRSPAPPLSMGRFSASPLASTATVSLVEVSESTVTRLNERSTARRSTPVSAPRPTAGAGTGDAGGGVRVSRAGLHGAPHRAPQPAGGRPAPRRGVGGNEEERRGQGRLQRGHALGDPAQRDNGKSTRLNSSLVS